jgi:hypothetical protein
MKDMHFLRKQIIQKISESSIDTHRNILYPSRHDFILNDSKDKIITIFKDQTNEYIGHHPELHDISDEIKSQKIDSDLMKYHAKKYGAIFYLLGAELSAEEIEDNVEEKLFINEEETAQIKCNEIQIK